MATLLQQRRWCRYSFSNHSKYGGSWNSSPAGRNVWKCILL